MTHWIDSFMAIFGFKRVEVWEAEQKEQDEISPALKSRPNKISTKPHDKSHDKMSRPVKLLTFKELLKDDERCHIIYKMVDASTDAEIAKEIGATVNAVKKYRLFLGLKRR